MLIQLCTRRKAAAAALKTVLTLTWCRTPVHRLVTLIGSYLESYGSKQTR